jgi:hypothetical protein
MKMRNRKTYKHENNKKTNLHDMTADAYLLPQNIFPSILILILFDFVKYTKLHQTNKIPT